MKVVAMIPARYGATRFPGKLMADLGGKPVILRTYLATLNTGLFDQVYVVNNDLGKPDLKISGKAAEIIEKLKVKNIQVSLTHSHDNAIAFVILEE